MRIRRQVSLIKAARVSGLSLSLFFAGIINAMTKIYVDADGCPVKSEVYRVAERYALPVVLVANKPLSLPSNPLLEMVVVTGAFDAADDWIVEHSRPGDILVTADILLADRCVKKSVRVLGPNGVEFTPDNIGSAVATRELLQELRAGGEMHGGPAPMDKKARSRFLSRLDEIIQFLKRRPYGSQ
jgi:uncharacterized protein YaiI (UPF0178 family)